jgi:uncharacterized membrane protein YkgB
MQQRPHRKTKRLKTATSNIDPVISEEVYMQWIISHQKGRAWQYQQAVSHNNNNNKGRHFEKAKRIYITKDTKPILAYDFLKLNYSN